MIYFLLLKKRLICNPLYTVGKEIKEKRDSALQLTLLFSRDGENGKT